MRVVAGCMKIMQRITGLIKVVKTDFVTPVWISPLWPYDNICDIMVYGSTPYVGMAPKKKWRPH